MHSPLFLQGFPVFFFNRWIKRIYRGRYVTIRILVDYSHGDIAPTCHVSIGPTAGSMRIRHSEENSKVSPGRSKGFTVPRALCRQWKINIHRRQRHSALSENWVVKKRRRVPRYTCHPSWIVQYHCNESSVATSY